MAVLPRRASYLLLPALRVYREVSGAAVPKLWEDGLLTSAKFGVAVLLAGAVLAVSGAARADGDAKDGKKVFRQCQACHVADKKQNRVGPYLLGVIGRPAGTAEGFKYSDAMANSGVTWDEDTIAQYLADPKGFIPGNKMVFAGLKKPEQIEDVIAYLESVSE